VGRTIGGWIAIKPWRRDLVGGTRFVDQRVVGNLSNQCHLHGVPLLENSDTIRRTPGRIAAYLGTTNNLNMRRAKSVAGKKSRAG
ncbi:MAG: hypothetical protein MI757_22720, partial [Pirellulales bacterium]|nr:hypothetical protein [Pirellulales bacterium]